MLVRLMVVFLCVLFASHAVVADEEDFDEVEALMAEDDGEEADSSSSAPPPPELSEAERAQQEKVQRTYMNYLLRRSTKSCRKELEKVFATPVEQREEQPFTESCTQEISKVRSHDASSRPLLPTRA
jgi:hypothetical protein